MVGDFQSGQADARQATEKVAAFDRQRHLGVGLILLVPTDKLSGCQWAVDQIALNDVAASLFQELLLSFGLNAFGNHFDSQSVPEAQNGFRNGDRSRVTGKISDEAQVDF